MMVKYKVFTFMSPMTKDMSCKLDTRLLNSL